MMFDIDTALQAGANMAPYFLPRPREKKVYHPSYKEWKKRRTKNKAQRRARKVNRK